MTFYTLEEASKQTGKTVRTIRRYIDKLSDNDKKNVTKKQNNKLLISEDFVKKLTNVTLNVTDVTPNVTLKEVDSDDLKRQISRLEKKLDEKESELKSMTNKHLEDIKILTSKVLSLEDAKTKLSEKAMTDYDKIQTEKNDLLIQKTKLEERLAFEKSKNNMTYFFVFLFIVLLFLLFMIISFQVF
jgi:hypothetical protein